MVVRHSISDKVIAFKVVLTQLKFNTLFFLLIARFVLFTISVYWNFYTCLRFSLIASATFKERLWNISHKFLQNQTLHRNIYLFLNIRCKDRLAASKIHLRSNRPNPSTPIHFPPHTIFFLYSINEVFHFPVFLFFTTITKYSLFWLFSSCSTMWFNIYIFLFYNHNMWSKLWSYLGSSVETLIFHKIWA